ncbi:MAG: bifunctional hydroxymethylpyrimidine kinase/phosphomethylpyrimidine kinase [Verrucomicrobiota bacterium]
MARQENTPVALTIAGSDCSGGAGMQADLKTFTAFGVYGLTAVTGVVSEVPGKVSRIEAVGPSFLRDQLELLFEAFPVAAVKTGLLCSAPLVTATCDFLESLGDRLPPVVVDPVMVATSGDPLLATDAISAYQERLFQLASLITPNLSEAGYLLQQEVTSLDAMKIASRELHKRHGTDVLLKGGHLTGEVATDLLVHHQGEEEFSAPFTRGVNTHGTGCTYSAAIAAGLACGHDLISSIEHAKAFVSATIAHYHRWSAGERAIDALNHAVDPSSIHPS